MQAYPDEPAGPKALDLKEYRHRRPTRSTVAPEGTSGPGEPHRDSSVLCPGSFGSSGHSSSSSAVLCSQSEDVVALASTSCVSAICEGGVTALSQAAMDRGSIKAKRRVRKRLGPVIYLEVDSERTSERLFISALSIARG